MQDTHSATPRWRIQRIPNDTDWAISERRRGDKVELINRQLIRTPGAGRMGLYIVYRFPTGAEALAFFDAATTSSKSQQGTTYYSTKNPSTT